MLYRISSIFAIYTPGWEIFHESCKDFKESVLAFTLKKIEGFEYDVLLKKTVEIQAF